MQISSILLKLICYSNFIETFSFADMLDSLDSVVDRNESPSPSAYPLGPNYPPTAPIKPAAPSNGNMFIKQIKIFSTILHTWTEKLGYQYLINIWILESRLLHASPTKKMEPSIPEEAESETGSHLNVNGVISEN